MGFFTCPVWFMLARVHCVRGCKVLPSLLLLLHTKEDGLGGGSESAQPIRIKLPGLQCIRLADADCH